VQASVFSFLLPLLTLALMRASSPGRLLAGRDPPRSLGPVGRRRRASTCRRLARATAAPDVLLEEAALPGW